MSPLRWFASIRERRRRSAQEASEEGARIARRLQELLAVPTLTKVEIASINVCGENETIYVDEGVAPK
jgi:hypothetical protein